GSVAQWIAIIVLVAVIATAAWFFFFRQPAGRGPMPAAPNPQSLAAASSAPQHPISQAKVPASASTAPLPAAGQRRGCVGGAVVVARRAGPRRPAGETGDNPQY